MADFSQWRSDDDAQYDQVLHVDVSELEPLVTYGYKPDLVKPISEMVGTPVDQVYLGSCTNGRLEDLRVAAQILKGKKIAPNVRGILSPATPKIYREAVQEGLMEIFMEAGFCVTNPTCGACLGMSNGVLAEGEVCASTTNRNFMGRMGKGGNGSSHVTGHECGDSCGRSNGRSAEISLGLQLLRDEKTACQFASTILQFRRLQVLLVRVN